MARCEGSDESNFSDLDFDPDDVDETSHTTRNRGRSSPLPCFQFDTRKMPRKNNVLAPQEKIEKQYKPSKWKKHRDLMAAAHTDVSVEIPEFASTRRWASWAEFEKDFDSYLKKNWLIYRKRSNVKTTTNNSSLASGKYAYVNFHVPEKQFEYVYRQYYCTHGCFDGPKGKGVRVQASFRFTGCEARIFAFVHGDGNGNLYIKTRNEKNVHNHNVSEEIYRTLMRGGSIDANALGGRVDLLRQTQVPMRNLAEYLSSETGCDLSNQDVRNYCMARYGGHETEVNLQYFVDAYVESPGNYCRVLKEDDDVTCGLILISQAQVEIYRRWGDSMLLDWTYNVNNLGFFLGELMVTSASGKGISVCEMLVANQRGPTIQACLEFFKRVIGNVFTESITIDKDFNEWRIIEKLFVNTKVVLCQFHAITAVKKKLADPKYRIIGKSRRDPLEIAWRAAICAPCKSTFDLEWSKLCSKSREYGTGFAKYLDENWYGCRDMWATHLRTKIFTAANTTTNRLEATWGQMKKLLNLTVPLDHCIGGILLHQNATMRELRGDLIRRRMHSHFNPRDAAVIQRLGGKCSGFVYNHLQSSFREYEAKRSGYHVLVSNDKKVRLHVQGGTEVVMCCGSYTCSCDYFLSCRLPCCHLIFLALEVWCLKDFPESFIQPRWRYNAVDPMINILKRSIMENDSLRKLLATPTKQLMKCEVPRSFRNNSQYDRKQVDYIKLKRGELSKDKLLVKSDVEKHNIALNSLAPIINDMVQSSSEVFFEKLAKVDFVVKQLMNAFSSSSPMASTTKKSAVFKDKSGDENFEGSSSQKNTATRKNGLPSQSDKACHSDEWLDTSDEELAPLLTELDASSNRFSSRNSCSGRKPCLERDRNPELASHTTATRKRGRSADPRERDAFHTLEHDNQDTCTVNGTDRPTLDFNGADRPTLDFNGADRPTLDFNGADRPTLIFSDVNPIGTKKKKTHEERQPQFSVFSLPKRIQSSKNNSRKRGGTKKLKHPVVAVEISIEEYSRGIPIGDVVAWLERSNNHDKINQVLSCYPVVRNRPKDAMTSVRVDASKTRGAVMSIGVVFGYPIVQNALAALRSDISISTMVYPRPRFALQLLPDKTPYHDERSLLWTMQDFYRLKSDYREYSRAVKWLSRNWGDDMFETDCLDVPGMTENELAGAIQSRLNFASLSSYVVYTTVMETKISVTLMEIVSSIPGKEWLKDSPISLLLQLACNRHGRAAFVESVVGNPEMWSMPKEQERDIEIVVAPCNTSGIHWTLVILDLCESNAMVYDPLDNNEFRAKTRERIKHVFCPTVDNWRRHKYGDKKCFPRWKMSVMAGPEQPDSVSCGVFVASMGWAYLHEETGWLALRGKAPRQASLTLRMRMLYQLLCSPEVKVVIPESEISQDIAKTEKLLDKLIAEPTDVDLKE